MPVLVLTIASEESKGFLLGPFEKLPHKYPIFGNTDWKKLLNYVLQEKYFEKSEQIYKGGVTKTFWITEEGEKFLELLR